MPLDAASQILIRWPAPDPRHVPLLKQAGVDAVLMEEPNPGFENALADAKIAAAPVDDARANIMEALWPGVRREGNRNSDSDVASASREPWVDQNGHLYPIARALQPGKPAVGGFLPNEKSGLTGGRSVAFDTLELALIEARVNGGNYILSVEPRYREALLKGDEKALAAWKSLGRTAAWLKENAALFGRRPLPGIAVLVEPGYPTREIANLLYRRNGSPAIVNATAPLPKDARVLVAAGLNTVPEAAWDFARAGGTVATDAAPPSSAKVEKKDPDRDHFTLGRGHVVAYHKKIADPSEFALDAIDLLGLRGRVARLWNAPSAVVMATEGARAGDALLHVINYGSPARDVPARNVQGREVQARIRGHFTSATLSRPEGPEITLKTSGRGAMTEVYLPVSRVAVVRFS